VPEGLCQSIFQGPGIPVPVGNCGMKAGIACIFQVGLHLVQVSPDHPSQHPEKTVRRFERFKSLLQPARIHPEKVKVVPVNVHQGQVIFETSTCVRCFPLLHADKIIETNDEKNYPVSIKMNHELLLLIINVYPGWIIFG